MRVLVTGASGFLGSHLCRSMAAAGHEVRALCRSTSDVTGLGGLPLELVAGDVTDRSSVRRAVAGRDWVVHAAAKIQYWTRDRDEQRTVNIEGARIVAQVCREAKVRRLVHVSSVAAVGIPVDPSRPADEGFAFNLQGARLPYHVSKWLAEQAVGAEVRRGLDAVIVNPASIFGPHRDGYRGAEMMRKVRRHNVIPYFTGGICVVHVDDVVAGIHAALERGVAGERYILGGENVSYRSLAERAAASMGLSRRFVPVPPAVTALAALLLQPYAVMRARMPRMTFAAHYCASRSHYYDSSRARAAFGYSPRGYGAILAECLRVGAV